MLTLFSFIITFLGSLNWFFISAFQYDFIAGFFGTQSSLFSRFCYFIIGIAGFILVVMAIKNKGKLKLTENPFKKPKENKNITPAVTPVKVVEPVETEENHYENEVPPLHHQKESVIYYNDLSPKEGYKDFDASKYDK